MSKRSPLFEPPATMSAVLLTGHGGLDKLEYRTDVATPRPSADQVLIEVAAAGVNNTDVNTRIGWYSKSVVEGTDAGGTSGFAALRGDDGAWSGTPMHFPRIQGADVCGRIITVGTGVSPERIGERVLVRTMQRTYVDRRPYEYWTLGSECDGGFAQFVVAAAAETFAVECSWSDVELAAVPCAYSTAENLLHRAKVVGGERVLVTGASGGVGLAAVQLAKRRGAVVIAVCSPTKAGAVIEHGADQTVDRGADLVEALGEESIDVVIDLVAGPAWPQLLMILRRGGRYAVAGAVGGPIAQIDIRTLYLKDLSLLGCTFQDDEVFENLLGYIERNEFRPTVSATYPLSDIVRAQEDFLSRKHIGKLVLIPPQLPA